MLRLGEVADNKVSKRADCLLENSHILPVKCAYELPEGNVGTDAPLKAYEYKQEWNRSNYCLRRFVSAELFF